ncbi:MAG: GvpL/GvpF family gas vesicle protein [Mariniphaga sp.]
MDEARYVYCVTEGDRTTSFGNIGIEGSEVYTIPFKGLCAVVHNCLSEPYKSDNKEDVISWVTVHEKVVEQVWEKSGSVLPLGFDTIIKGEEGIAPEENVFNWLKNDYEKLSQKLVYFRNSAEYGVQVFWDPKIISEVLIETTPEIKKLCDEIKLKSKGLAYMYKQKLENLLRKEMEKEVDRYFSNFYDQIKPCVNDIKIEKTKKPVDDKQMLLNFTCLLIKEHNKMLGDELEKINNLKGFSVRFTGPWPPYSFV